MADNLSNRGPPGLFSYFPDEISFIPSELIDLTEDEARGAKSWEGLGLTQGRLQAAVVVRLSDSYRLQQARASGRAVAREAGCGSSHRHPARPGTVRVSNEGSG